MLITLCVQAAKTLHFARAHLSFYCLAMWKKVQYILFDSLMVFLKEFFIKVDFEKKSADNKFPGDNENHSRVV